MAACQLESFDGWTLAFVPLRKPAEAKYVTGSLAS